MTKIIHTVITTVLPVPKSEADRRYRSWVTLNRSDRPRYWTFYCPQCQYPVCEIVNAEVVAVSDAMDMQNVETIGTGVRCDGKFQGGYCRIWWYFSLGK